tara:strand:+ start:1287 stop:1715 length:429 start_codon:yes stop_codon:yes gene_type:complete
MYNRNVVVLITNSKNFYLQLRDNDKSIPYAGTWGFFGGGIYPSESSFTAAKRELYEELNIKNFKNLSYQFTYFQNFSSTIFYVYKFQTNLIYFSVNEGIEGNFFNYLDFKKRMKKSKKNKFIYKIADNEVMEKFFRKLYYVL